MSEQLHSVHVAHPDVQDRHGDLMRRHMFEKGFRFAERMDFKARRLKEPGNRFPNRFIVIEETNNTRNVSHATTLACETAGAQSDLSPGSVRRSNFSFLQYYH